MRTLGESLPTLVDEVASLLRQEGEPELAKQVGGLPLVDRCRCGDDFCATIYTAASADRKYGVHRNIALHPQAGFLILDLRDQRMVCIEILYRPEIREQVLKLMP
jgi:hypothetical protein